MTTTFTALSAPSPHNPLDPFVNSFPDTLLESDAEPAHLATGITQADADRIGAALNAARAESTRKVYRHGWRTWQRWCQARGLTALPADPAALCAFLTDRAATGISVGTLHVTCSAIGYVHRSRGLDDPITHPALRQVRAGLRRSYGVAPRRPARPLTPADLRRILDHIDRASPKGARDAAVILLGFASAMRAGELTALTVADIAHPPNGLLLTIRRSKTDQEAHGQVVGVAPGEHRVTDPVAALDTWLRHRGHAPGPLFTKVWYSKVTLDPICPIIVTRMLHARADNGGLAADRITSHSLRAGHATTAALAGVPLEAIAAQTRHRDLTVLVERYIRPLNALATTSSRHLGL